MEQNFNTEAGLGDVFHKIKKHFHQSRANHHEDKAAYHHARAHAYLAKKLSAEDMKHYTKGHYDKMSDRGQKRINGRFVQKHMKLANEHDAKTNNHVEKAVQAHSDLHGIGKKKTKAMLAVAKRNSEYNKRVKSLNHIHGKLANTNNRRVHKNLQRLTKVMHPIAQTYKHNSKTIAKQNRLKKPLRSIHNRVKANYEAPKMKAPKPANAAQREDVSHQSPPPKVDSKPKPEPNPSNPHHPKNHVEEPTDLDTNHETKE